MLEGDVLEDNVGVHVEDSELDPERLCVAL